MRVHDLRHVHASLWLMASGSLADVQRNLGHSTPVLTSETYGHIADDHRVREADQRLALGLRSNPTADMGRAPYQQGQHQPPHAPDAARARSAVEAIATRSHGAGSEPGASHAAPLRQ
jgi:hypothetical protein